MNDNLRKIVEMCNYSADNTHSIISEDSGEIRPNDAAPALIEARGRIRAVSMRWGFERNDGKMIINARSESASERITFRNLVERNRCALPAAGYFEWRDADRLKHLVAPEDSDGFYLAGLYKTNDRGEPRFVVLTREAFGMHARIHSRMPLLLTSGAQVRRWLNGTLSLDELVASMPERLSVQPLGAEQMGMNFDDYPDM